MRLKIILSFFILFLLIISALTFWWKAFSNYEKTDNAYIRGSITNISSRISGYVEDVPGVLNTRVKKGDIIVRFEEEPFKAKYEIAFAELNGAEAMVKEIDATIISENIRIDEKKLVLRLSNAKIKSADAKASAETSNLKLMTEEKNRMSQLLKRKTISKAKFDKVSTNYEKSLYKLKQLKSNVEELKISHLVIKKEINQLKINLDRLVAQRSGILAKKDALESKLKSSQIDLESTIIRAPINGIIANRIVEPGVYMKKGWSLMSIVPTEDVWIISNYKETQIKNIKVGQKVEIKVDAYPKVELTGKVLSKSPASASSFSIIPPQNVSGNFVKVVQRVPVKISFELPDEYFGKIVPGLSVVTKVITSEKIN
ncbi:MAG: hypothetical protein CMP24_04655 [Rickettsiales bacterium]|nr:hypothetical protein [Rickettsiales bacterium]